MPDNPKSPRPAPIFSAATAGRDDTTPAAPPEPGPCCGKAWVIVGTVGAIMLALAVLALPVVWKGPDAGKLTPWTEYFGTLHPLVLHLPVGIVILVVTMEILGWLSFGRYKPQTIMPLGIGLLSAVAAVTLGYLLFMTGDYGKATIDRGIGKHMWGTIMFTVLLSAAFTAKIWCIHSGKRPALYGCLLLASIGALTLGAHKGAIITHGSDPVDGLLHLWKTSGKARPEKANGTEPTTTGDAQQKLPPGDRMAYAQVIVPLLGTYCYECHSKAGENPVHAAGKVKGKLSMTTLDALQKGGSSDLPALAPGDVENSYMIEVLRYDMAEDEHMPPEDSDQPSPEEIGLLEWWIKAGAPVAKTVSEIGGADAFLPVINALPMSPPEAEAE